MQFHEKLRQRVQDLGLNKAKAARDVGLPESTISNYLVKVDSLPRIDIARKIAAALKVPLDWLADDDAGFPVPAVDKLGLGTIPDHELMEEACRRLTNQAKRVAFDIERVKKENWPEIADQLLSIPAIDELSPEQERMNFLLSLLSGSSRDLREFDASYPSAHRDTKPPDLYDLKRDIEDLSKMPEFKTLEAYFSLRHVADYLKRHNATQADWDMRDVEGQRKHLISNLAKMRKISKPANP